MTTRRSSGSRCADISSDPIKSQNMTVSWRRSACSLALSRRVCAAAAGGVDAVGSAPGGVTRVPHCGQKFALAAQTYPQAGQASGAGAPHSVQNLATSGREAWQFKHSIESPPEPAASVIEAQPHCHLWVRRS